MSVLSDAERYPVALRLDAERWATRRVSRKVLFAVHTVTAGQRLLDVARLFEGDMRVQVFFTMAPDVFTQGVPEFLDGLGAVVLPWRQAVETRFDLAFAAAYGGLHELHAPVVVLPHGAGHNKLVSARRPGRAAADRGVYGLSPQWLVRDGAVVPDTIVLAHEEDRERLARHCPQALPAAAVVGDPCYDRIVASLPLRAHYRSALGVAPRQRLVVFSTTWGPRSLLGRAADVLERLVGELPRDEYRIAALLHPNAWNAHGAWQIRAWLAGLCRAGLTLVDQRADWCGVVAGADFIVGDHGSVTLYGSVTGVPVLLGSYAGTDVDTGSPMAELSAIAPRFTPSRSARKQLARSESAYRPEDHRRIAARITSRPSHFARRMHALAYRKLGLRPQTPPPVTEPAQSPVTTVRALHREVIAP